MSEINEFADREQRFRSWVEEYRAELLRMCILYLSDMALAEDAVQETLLKAWKGMDNFEGRNGCKPKTWLISIAINTCKSLRRSRWLRQTRCASLEEQLEGNLPGHAAGGTRPSYRYIKAARKIQSGHPALLLSAADPKRDRRSARHKPFAGELPAEKGIGYAQDHSRRGG